MYFCDEHRGTHVAAAVGLVHHIDPNQNEHHADEQIRQNGQNPRRLGGRVILVVGQDTVPPLLVDEHMEIAVKDPYIRQLVLDGGALLIRLIELQGQDAVLDAEVLDLLLLEQIHDLRVVFDFRIARRLEQHGN